VADDLGVGMSTLNKWIAQHRDTDVVSKEDLSLAQKNDRLQSENRLLKEGRDIFEKQRSSLQAKNREVQVYGRTPGHVSGAAFVSGCGGQRAWIAGFPQSACQPKARQ